MSFFQDFYFFFKSPVMGIVSLVRVSFCINPKVQRHICTNILIQTKGVKSRDICSRNRAFFHFKRFASRWKLVRTEKFLIERWKPIRKKLPLILSFLYFLTSITILAK